MRIQTCRHAHVQCTRWSWLCFGQIGVLEIIHNLVKIFSAQTNHYLTVFCVSNWYIIKFSAWSAGWLLHQTGCEWDGSCRQGAENSSQVSVSSLPPPTPCEIECRNKLTHFGPSVVYFVSYMREMSVSEEKVWHLLLLLQLWLFESGICLKRFTFEADSVKCPVLANACVRGDVLMCLYLST